MYILSNAVNIFCIFKGNCRDTDNGATDRDGQDCSSKWYKLYPQDCGAYDDDDFKANKMCCACNGGCWDKPNKMKA